jgi:F-type H+-transporting ATPase subunit a
MFSPLEQFEITPLVYMFQIFDWLGLPFTNFSFFALVFALIFTVFSSIALFSLRLVPTVRQYIFEALYEFVFSMLSSNLNQKGFKFFPYIFIIFTFILFFNLFGLFPYSFTLTSQIVVATVLSFTTFLGLIIIGLFKHRLNFFALFFPSEAPIALAFLLVPIELASFFSRPFSLAIRLFANMTAGHVLLKILAGFSLVLFSTIIGFIFTFNPLVLVAHIDAEFSDVFNTVFALCSLDYCSYLSYLIVTFNKELIMQATLEASEQLPRMHSIQFLFLVDLWRNQGYPNNELSELLSVHAVWVLRDAFNLLHPVNSESAADYLTMLALQNPIYFSKVVDLMLPVNLGFYVSLSPIIYVITLCTNASIFIVSAALPIIILFLFIVLELFVAILQAYVFSILTVIYLRDILDLH